MAEPIYEGRAGYRLRFDFPEPWLALKFDDAAWYRLTMKTRVKAMDVVACDGENHWWIEVKDCLGHEPANWPRLSPNDSPEVGAVRTWAKAEGHLAAVSIKRSKPFIVDEVAEKLEGTLLSVVAARRASAANVDAAKVIPMAGAMDAQAAWGVVLLLTWDPTSRDFGSLAMRLRDKLRQRLAAYRVACFVVNQVMPVPGQPWTLTRTA